MCSQHGWNTKHQWRSIDVLLAYRPYFELQNLIASIKSLAIDGTALPTGDLHTLPTLQAWLESVGLPTGGKDGAAIRRGLCEALRSDLHERTIGHMPSLNSDFFLKSGWEHIFHLTPTGRSPINRQAIGVPYVWKDQPERFGHGRDRHCRGSAWQFQLHHHPDKGERFHHRALTRVELVVTCLKLAKLAPDALVLDPFAGIDNTLLAAKALGIRAVGVEIDPAYAPPRRKSSSGWPANPSVAREHVLRRRLPGARPPEHPLRAATGPPGRRGGPSWTPNAQRAKSLAGL